MSNFISSYFTNKQTFSFEIFPPKGELSIETARTLVGELAKFAPDWISVTFSAGGSGNSGSTVAIAGEMQEQYGVTSLAHLTCMGASKEEIAERIAELKAAGVQNVLALRGDRMPGHEIVDFRYAADLVPQLKEAGFCVGGACYPEGHVECLDFSTSIGRLKAKQDSGTDFLVTQLFFDNEYFYRFREACDRARIKIPVTVGVMPFTSVAQIQRMAFTCGASIPSQVIKRLVAAGNDAEATRRAGIEFMCEQLRDLAANGVDGLHIYTMNRPDVAQAAYDTLVDCGYIHA
ncbi:MAG: methylenetetrahydrofolate reductase [Coriobacteriales bacterium]|nr:methylenetetrahydrofolate reductase [Coriobacteriales bacterium]